MRQLLMILFSTLLVSCSDNSQKESTANKSDSNITDSLPILDVDLPDSKSISEPIDHNNYFDVAITKESKFFTKDGEVTLDELERSLEEFLSVYEDSTNKPGLRISADKHSDFEMFTEVMDVAKKYDLKVSIVTD